MRSNRMLIGVVTAVVLALGSVATSSSEARTDHGHGDDASGDAVRAWNEIAVNTLIGLPGPAGGAPPAASVHVAMVQGAVFDAVNAIGRRHYRPYLLKKRFSGWASKDAAVAAAAYGVLLDIVSTVPPEHPGRHSGDHARHARHAVCGRAGRHPRRLAERRRGSPPVRPRPRR